MSIENSLQRFVAAQEHKYEKALTEIRNGHKRSHWMWYIFPQIDGLGFSDMSRLYGIKGLEEAADYLDHPVLGNRLLEMSHTLLALENDNATEIMGSPDDLKLRSCMTLFSLVPGADPVFEEVLSKFFSGKKDNATLELIA